MGYRKRRCGDWHHRVPDFKLVYCGPRSSAKKEAEPPLQKKADDSSFTDSGELQFLRLEETKAEKKQ